MYNYTEYTSYAVYVYIQDYMQHNGEYLRSPPAKGARSIFITSEKNAPLCASLHTRPWKTQYQIYNIFFPLATFGPEKRPKGKGQDKIMSRYQQLEFDRKWI